MTFGSTVLTLLSLKSPRRPLRFFTLPPVIVPRMVFFSTDPGVLMPCGPPMEVMEPLTEAESEPEVEPEALRSSKGMSAGGWKPDL